MKKEIIRLITLNTTKRFIPTILIFILVIYSIQIRAQINTVSSKIVDKNGEGIAYATIGIPKQNYGIVTFENGNFTLQVIPAFTMETIEISALGYKKQLLSYRDFIQNTPDQIVLKEAPLTLNEVVVTPNKINYSRMGITKKTSSKNFAQGTPSKGYTITRLFNSDESLLLLKEISVAVSTVNLETFQLRCRVFKLDPETKLPAEDLLTENLIYNGIEKNNLATFKFKEGFWIDEPFFIGIEWVVSKAQFNQMQKVEITYPADFIDDIIVNNPKLTHHIFNDKKVLLKDSANNTVKTIKLTKLQTTLLKNKSKANPRLRFKILNQDSNTYFGSSITNRWERLNNRTPLISVLVGKKDQ